MLADAGTLMVKDQSSKAHQDFFHQHSELSAAELVMQEPASGVSAGSRCNTVMQRAENRPGPVQHVVEASHWHMLW